jgi:Dullard-like phosphatase family protein
MPEHDARILLILDLDETLIYATEKPLDRTPDFVFERFSVYKRPHVEVFLSEVSKTFDLSLWTSATTIYTQEILKKLTPCDVQFKFVWTRERCTKRRDLEKQEEEWLKDLRKIKRLGYELGRVLVVDDTAAKYSRSYGNLITVAPYFGSDEDSELVYLAKYLESLKEIANVRSVEKRNWKSVAKISI